MRWLLGVLLLIVFGCAAPRTPLGAAEAPSDAVFRAEGPPGPRGYHSFIAAVPYASAPLPPRTKIFLVAGGVEVANFAAEVVAQRHLWRSLGYAEDEIACYWAQPTALTFRHDRAQYRELAAELRPCYPASTELLREHLQATSRRAPDFVYLYVSSHGVEHLLPPSLRPDTLLPGERELLDQTAIQLGAGPGRGVEARSLITAMRRGADPDDLVFSPRVLRALLLDFPPATRKHVVLQACHSGGFLADPRPAREDHTLAAVPNLIAIASARFDRTSFGCHPGARMTHFGRTYNRLLGAYTGETPRALDQPGIDWVALFTELRAEISELERSIEVRHSRPLLLKTE